MFLCCFGFVGCTDEKANEREYKETIAQLEQQVDELQEELGQHEKDREKGNEPAESVEQQNGIIQLIDPYTNEVIATFSAKDLGYESDVELYKKEIEQLARELARGTETEAGYDQRMVLDRLSEDGEIVKGSPMIILKEAELVDNILAVSDIGGTVELPLYKTETEYLLEDVPSLDEVVVASYTTYFNESDTGRNKNIELSAKAIHNTIIGNGDIFSFNTMVGPRTEETGYQPATEIVNGEFVMGIGGGICQTSSTLFNAVDQAGVKMVERHHHSIPIGYVPTGRDATVSYGTLDFRFENTTGVPFLITTNTTQNSITIEVRTAKKYENQIQ